MQRITPPPPSGPRVPSVNRIRRPDSASRDRPGHGRPWPDEPAEPPEKPGEDGGEDGGDALPHIDLMA